jgi:cytochrome P450
MGDTKTDPNVPPIRPQRPQTIDDPISTDHAPAPGSRDRRRWAGSSRRMPAARLPKGPTGLMEVWSSVALVYRPKRFYAWLRRRYGEIATLSAGGTPFVFALTSDAARQVLTNDPDQYEAFNKKAFSGLTGAGSLWVMDGTRHRQERQLLAPRFNAHCVRGFGPAIRESALLHTDAWQVGQVVRAYDAMLDISREVILRVMFGTGRGGMIDEGRRTLTMLLEAAHPLHSLEATFQAWWFPPWRRYLRAKEQFSTFVARLLAERRAGGNESQGILGPMLAASSDDGPRISDQEICDELITILLSGHETTAVALAWTLYELARHPTVLERLRGELDELGPDPLPDLVARQPYLGAVCDETLRLHTILTEIGRIARAPCELLGHTLPAGVGVGVGIGAIHQDPSLYPDPDEFRPERFIERTYSAFEFMPFGGGHRRCLGAHLSDYEMRTVIALIATRWDLEVLREDYDIRHNIGSGPKHGILLRVSGRRGDLRHDSSMLQ